MIRRHTISIKHAFKGIIWALKTQPNYQVHILFSIIAVGAGFFYNISSVEFIVIILLITIGIVIETINTSIEATTDAIDLKWRDDIRIAKDVAAAAMLIFAVGAVIIAGIIFIPKMM